MRITDIKPLPVWVGNRNQLVVKVETDEGIYGLGESGLSGRELAVIGALQHFREFLVGKDPMQIGRIWQELYRSQYFEGGRVLLAAQSAIDLALYDIAGKALNVPVYQLLGGKQREAIPCFATASGAGPALVEDVKLLMQHGWTVIRTAPMMPDAAGGFVGDSDLFDPRASIPLTAHWLTKVREECGSEIVLGIDYHHRLSIAETASFCQRMPAGTLDFLEEPIRDETPEAYAALRKLTPVPFAVGEEFASKWQFLPYIEQHLTDFARVDICNVGGFTEAMKVAGWAEAHYIDLMPHNPLGPVCTAATLHLAAAVPNFAWLEVRVTPTENLYYGAAGVNEADLLFPVQPRLDGTVFPVPTAPGLGVEIDEERARSQEWRFWEAPHWRRPDGSVTNW
ncbi:MAG: mandelate racemase/muconate lactonizing enzyme family protein [Caldilinea sp.]|nr:mandelate racemase/muconate lactonizing enzyme family protein [Caldilineaceae bacterium]MCB9124672.1 mandelate racemase/muconate lactonizing enzyme family protein [Caldilineaceae bacterium]MCO5212371.1 mandelate racemase/muconate lactonizing enzyme family protein [Caldilinea sp.]MCW5842216.1 mandelate racemase/muconate lactonizing enzyme family protein [Caldilinea sp.]